ncbi:MAG: Short-chain dehydrogenase/reductase [Frankiales bacterium]|nr:Short-chain dehydrogenase/reductase [Frankiales bacterium]
MLTGRTVLLTGATGGLGGTLARRLRASGAELVLTGRREAELAALAAETGARAIPADLSDAAEVHRLLVEVGAVDVLVSNAALPGTGALTSFTAEQAQRALDVNLGAAVALAHGLLPRMLSKRSGSLVFVSSLAGLTPTPHTSLYNATKFGLRGFALSLHEELRGTGVGAGVVLPGFVRDVGMFAETGLPDPRLFGTCTPDAVADAVLRMIETNPAQLLVGPFTSRVGARLGSLAPALAFRLQRLGLLRGIGRQMADAQQHKR